MKLYENYIQLHTSFWPVYRDQPVWSYIHKERNVSFRRNAKPRSHSYRPNERVALRGFLHLVRNRVAVEISFIQESRLLSHQF